MFIMYVHGIGGIDGAVRLSRAMTKCLFLQSTTLNRPSYVGCMGRIFSNTCVQVSKSLLTKSRELLEEQGVT